MTITPLECWGFFFKKMLWDIVKIVLESKTHNLQNTGQESFPGSKLINWGAISQSRKPRKSKSLFCFV